MKVLSHMYHSNHFATTTNDVTRIKAPHSINTTWLFGVAVKVIGDNQERNESQQMETRARIMQDGFLLLRRTIIIRSLSWASVYFFIPEREAVRSATMTWKIERMNTKSCYAENVILITCWENLFISLFSFSFWADWEDNVWSNLWPYDVIRHRSMFCCCSLICWNPYYGSRVIITSLPT